MLGNSELGPRFGFVVPLTLVLCLLIPAAYAEFPDRPVTLITPFGAGGSHDLNARVMTSYIHRYLGQPMINRLVPGQAGQKGILETINATPDGYTLVFLENYLDQLHRHTFRNEHYDTNRDLVPVARTNYGQVGVIVRGDSKYQTWSDLEADARARPGQLKASHSGLWGALFVPAGQLMTDLNLRFRMVPYRGGGPAKAALLAGDVDLSLGFPATLANDIESGRVRVLATAGTTRILDDVPSFAEIGLPPTAGFMHRVIMAPFDTPADRLAVLRRAFAQLQDDEDYQATMSRLGENTEYMDGEEYEAVRQQQAKDYAALASAIAAQ